MTTTPPPIQNLNNTQTPPPPVIVKTGITYYDDNVFPRMANGEKVFNWYAGLFGVFWLPYKGLWKMWASNFIPYAIVVALLDAMNLAPVSFGMACAFIWSIGRSANERYLDNLRVQKKDTTSVGVGIGGVFAYLAIFVFMTSFWNGFIPAFTKNFNKTRVSKQEVQYLDHQNLKQPQQQVVEQTEPPQMQETDSTNREIASTKTYETATLALVDGENAIGNRVKITGLYAGLTVDDGVPLLAVTDSNGGGVWMIRFTDRFKAEIASLKQGSAYNFECTITSLDMGVSECLMQ